MTATAHTPERIEYGGPVDPAFDFEIAHVGGDKGAGLRASTMRAQSTEEELRLHRDLFPEEAALLGAGYDWDARNVYRDAQPTLVDGFDRYVETRREGMCEWVRVVEEMTWRRYPIAVTVTVTGKVA